MKKIFTCLLSLFLLNVAITKLYAQTIWNGSALTFSQTSSSGPADQITAAVALTRGAAQGLYNSSTEQGYTPTSPAGTEWAYGTLTNFASLTYAPWETWHGKAPPSMIGKDAVLHLINGNIYIGIKFLSWENGRQGGDGGFSYQRTTASVLPITLKSFGASLQNGQAILQWKTATEINNQYFEVERCTNGINFSPVGRVTGNGSSGVEHTYSFKDNTPASGTYYYRLAQHDLDGTIRYSSIIRLSQKSNVSLSLLPNPAIDFIRVISSNSMEGSAFNITNDMGQTIKKGIISTQQIDIHELPSGQYRIIMQDANGTMTGAWFLKR